MFVGSGLKLSHRQFALNHQIEIGGQTHKDAVHFKMQGRRMQFEQLDRQIYVEES